MPKTAQLNIQIAILVDTGRVVVAGLMCLGLMVEAILVNAGVVAVASLVSGTDVAALQLSDADTTVGGGLLDRRADGAGSIIVSHLADIDRRPGSAALVNIQYVMGTVL